jgi:hypothetical protein
VAVREEANVADAVEAVGKGVGGEGTPWRRWQQRQVGAATTFQISSSLWVEPNDGMPVILMPFFAIQNSSPLDQRATTSGR